MRDELRPVAELELVVGRGAALAVVGEALEERCEPFPPLRVLPGRMQARKGGVAQDVDRAIRSSSSRLFSPCARPTR